ncbi:MAG: hypothetical protein Kow0076_7430 [Francisella sp.]
MSRLQQNVMYIVILLLVFVACVYFFVPNHKVEAKAIYLPNISVDYPAVDPSEVKTYPLRYQSDMQGNIGQVRSLIYVHNEQDFQSLCDKNLQEAIKLAAQHGANIIKYICLYPEGQINDLSSVQLRGYTFRE